MRKKERRRRLIADWKLQGKFCLRVAFYWVACQSAITVAIFGLLALEGFEAAGSATLSPWRFLIPALAVSAALLPLVLLDLLLFTNKLVGPLHRFRKHLHHIAAGQEVDDLYFRPGDMLLDLSQNINTIQSRNRDEHEVAELSEVRQFSQQLSQNGDTVDRESLLDPKGSQPTTAFN